MWEWEEISEFFWTKTTYRQVYGEDFSSFRLLDITHISMLLAAAVIIVSVILFFKRSDGKVRKKITAALTALLLFDEALKYIYTLLTGQFEPQFLPFHLCSVNIFVCLWNTIRPSRIAANILYGICLPAAVIALIMPSWTALPVWNLMTIHSETVHIMLVLYPLLLLAGGFRPDAGAMPGIILFVISACIPAMTLNYFFDTNFMFLKRTDNNALLELFASFLGEKYYIAGIAVLLAVVVCLMYLPWIIRSRSAQKRLGSLLK